jgi:hypothetical protein
LAFVDRVHDLFVRQRHADATIALVRVYSHDRNCDCGVFELDVYAVSCPGYFTRPWYTAAVEEPLAADIFD